MNKVYAIQFADKQYYSAISLYVPHISLARFFSSEKNAETQIKQYEADALDSLNFMADCICRCDDVTEEDLKYYKAEHAAWKNAKIVCFELKRCDEENSD